MAVKTTATSPVVRQPGDQFQRDAKLKIETLSRSPMAQGVLLTGVALTTGTTQVSHTLGRPYRGFMVVDSVVAVTVRRDPVSTDLPETFLPLIASAAATVSLWVF